MSSRLYFWRENMIESTSSRREIEEAPSDRVDVGVPAQGRELVHEQPRLVESLDGAKPLSAHQLARGAEASREDSTVQVPAGPVVIADDASQKLGTSWLMMNWLRA